MSKIFRFNNITRLYMLFIITMVVLVMVSCEKKTIDSKKQSTNSSTIVSTAPATSQELKTTQNSAATDVTPKPEKYELAPKELNFELFGSQIVLTAEGNMSVEEFTELKCNNKAIAVIKNRIKNGFISTRDYGKIKVELIMDTDPISVKFYILPAQQTLLLKNLK